MSAATITDDYSGPFDPDWQLERLSRGLARLAREVMLVSMLHDRSLMPHVATRGGTAASVALADDEWMSASPIYTTRNKANLGIDGDTAADVLKSFQFDIGTPHHFLDMHGEVVDDRLASFWLAYCGAHDYVRWVSGNDPGIVTMMCHQMEDNTFDATLKVTNPRARAVPVHRPPKPDELAGEHCRWEIRILDHIDSRPDNPNLEILWSTRAAGFELRLGDDREPGGLTDYSRDYIPGLRLDDFSHTVLVRQVKEFSLDVHLLIRAAHLSVLHRHGAELLAEAGPQHIEALAPALVTRLREAMAIEGDGPDAIAKVLQLNPLLPPDYVAFTVDLEDDGTVVVEVRPCAALDDRDTPSPLDQLDDDEPAVLLALARAVNPRVTVRVDDTGAPRWMFRIDPDREPEPQHSLAEIVGGHNLDSADLGAREVPVSLRR